MTTFNTPGNFTFTAPTTGYYDIIAYGAQGGGALGDAGAVVGGDFNLTAAVRSGFNADGPADHARETVAWDSARGGIRCAFPPYGCERPR